MQKTIEDLRNGNQRWNLNLKLTAIAYLRIQHEAARRANIEGSCAMCSVVQKLAIENLAPFPGELELNGKQPPRKLAAKATKPTRRPVKHKAQVARASA